MFIPSGLTKIAQAGPTVTYIAAAGLPAPEAALIIAVLVEVIGGLLLVAGYHIRHAAVVLAAFTVAAAIGFHADFADQNQMIHFMKNIAIVGGLLQVAAYGAGRFSIDAAIRRR
jgi:putative oxidoreductase